jgi:hypothetical protein
VPLRREDGVEEDAAEGDLGPALVAERVVDRHPDDAPRDQMDQDQGGQEDPQFVPIPTGGVEHGVGGIVVTLGGQAGGLPDLADRSRADTKDPTGQQRLKGRADLRVEAIAERLYQRRERGDKLIHRADLRAVRDPGVLQHPPGYRPRA